MDFCFFSGLLGDGDNMVDSGTRWQFWAVRDRTHVRANRKEIADRLKGEL